MFASLLEWMSLLLDLFPLQAHMQKLSITYMYTYVCDYSAVAAHCDI